MFYGCSSLTDINSLKNWNVSNDNDFDHMFTRCSLLSDMTPIQNWKIQKYKLILIKCTN